MSIKDKTLKLCSCNKTIPLDAAALGSALKSGSPITVHTELCRKEAGQFQAGSATSRSWWAARRRRALRRARRGGGVQGRAALRQHPGDGGLVGRRRAGDAEIAALAGRRALPDPEPVPNVEYKSGGQVLVIGPSVAALEWAGRLAASSPPMS